MEADPTYGASSSDGTKGATRKLKSGQNAKAQTVVKMSGNNGRTREQQVKNLDEVKSRSEPQKKPQVV
jgi:type IV secretory pathway TrbL component